MGDLARRERLEIAAIEAEKRRHRRSELLQVATEIYAGTCRSCISEDGQRAINNAVTIAKALIEAVDKGA